MNIEINHTAKRQRLPLLAVLLSVVSLPLLLADAAPARDGMPVAAFMPGVSIEAVAGALAPFDGRILAEGRLPGLWLVTAEAAGLADSLKRAGALFVFDPDRLPGCFDRTLPALRTGDPT